MNTFKKVALTTLVFSTLTLAACGSPANNTVSTSPTLSPTAIPVSKYALIGENCSSAKYFNAFVVDDLYETIVMKTLHPGSQETIDTFCGILNDIKINGADLNDVNEYVADIVEYNGAPGTTLDVVVYGVSSTLNTGVTDSVSRADTIYYSLTKIPGHPEDLGPCGNCGVIDLERYFMPNSKEVFDVQNELLIKESSLKLPSGTARELLDDYSYYFYGSYITSFETGGLSEIKNAISSNLDYMAKTNVALETVVYTISDYSRINPNAKISDVANHVNTDLLLLKQ